MILVAIGGHWRRIEAAAKRIKASSCLTRDEAVRNFRGNRPEGAMELLNVENPVFRVYLIAVALTVLKVMGQGWMTVYRMMRAKTGWASPEDLRPGLYNPVPDPSQLDLSDYVDRSRRMHRNDLENIPAFWAVGFAFVAISPPLWLAQLLMYGFVAARALHALAYATRQSHELRSVFYTVGSLIVMAMAVQVLVAVVTFAG
jgi:uncharacterized MAPEG superfamily protein